MNREDILKIGKEENQKRDPYELAVNAKAAALANAAMLVLAFVIFWYEMAKGTGLNPAIYALIAVNNCVVWGYRALKIDKYKKLNTFSSITWGILTVYLMLDYFGVI